MPFFLINLHFSENISFLFFEGLHAESFRLTILILVADLIILILNKSLLEIIDADEIGVGFLIYHKMMIFFYIYILNFDKLSSTTLY